jgi:hypothetical protein
MNEPSLTPRHAWQPFTPRGAAGFAAASLGRLLLVQFFVAALVATMVAWFVSAAWFSVVRQGIDQLPEGAVIRDQRLYWTTNTPLRLAENRFLGLGVDAKNTGGLGRAADVELGLHDTHCQLSSLMGFVELRYPPGWVIPLSRTAAWPWWGAREWTLLVSLMALVVLALMTSWLALATVYCPLAKTAAFFANRRLTWAGAWKLSGASLMPGAFLIIAGIFAYGWLEMDLVRLGLLYLLHILTGWVYLVASPFFLPKDSAAGLLAPNPFQPADVEAEKPRPDPENPFAAPP